MTEKQETDGIKANKATQKKKQLSDALRRNLQRRKMVERSKMQSEHIKEDS